jgi:hypothetical protein
MLVVPQYGKFGPQYVGGLFDMSPYIMYCAPSGGYIPSHEGNHRRW